MHVGLTEEVPAIWKAPWSVHCCPYEVWKPFLLWPEMIYQEWHGVSCRLELVEHHPDQREGRKGIQLLVVPVVKDYVRRHSTGIPKRE